jgi:hypothetical protein
MAMNPTGGLTGPGTSGKALTKRYFGLGEHSIRHDALGFLLTFFGVGPGYGTLGRDDPLAGQAGGFLRELILWLPKACAQSVLDTTGGNKTRLGDFRISPP